MPLPSELFSMSISDYMLERYKRLERNSIYNVFCKTWDQQQWLAVNRYWFLQYCGVKCGKIDPKMLRD